MFNITLFQLWQIRAEVEERERVWREQQHSPVEVIRHASRAADLFDFQGDGEREQPEQFRDQNSQESQSDMTTSSTSDSLVSLFQSSEQQSPDHVPSREDQGDPDPADQPASPPSPEEDLLDYEEEMALQLPDDHPPAWPALPGDLMASPAA